MNIDTMKIEDYEEVYTLWLNTTGMGLNTIDDSKDGIQKYLKRNPKTCFIARENKKIVGAILCGHDGRRGYIHHTAMEKEFRCKGIGRKLVEKAVKSLREECIHKVAFVVFSKNSDGNKFWDSLGFKCRDDLTYRDKIISEDEMRRIDM